MTRRRVILIGVPGSHPVKAVELMIRHKGLPFTRVDLPTFLRVPLMRVLGFRSEHVPVALVDGRRVIGSLAIGRALERARPDPPLYPAPAEQWAHDVLQESVRQLSWWGMVHDPAGMPSFLDGAHMGMPAGLVKRMMPLIQPLVVRELTATDDTLRRALAEVGEQLDHVDALLEQGALGGPELNAADFHVAAYVRLAMSLASLRPRIEARPAGRHALRVCPDYPGTFTRAIPAAWLPG